MAFESLHIKIIQDSRREIECWCFSPEQINDTEAYKLVAAHHDVFDMFLCPQPLIAVKEEIKHQRGAGAVSKQAYIVIPEYLNPPYNLFLVNTHALEILEGETITDKLANLVDFYVGKEQKGFLTAFLEDMLKKRLFIVATC